jgi:hypothetical protein
LRYSAKPHKATLSAAPHKDGFFYSQGLISEVLYNRPANPKQFIVDYLEKIKVAGTKPLLTQDDLKIMFGMCKYHAWHK